MISFFDIYNLYTMSDIAFQTIEKEKTHSVSSLSLFYALYGCVVLFTNTATPVPIPIPNNR